MVSTYQIPFGEIDHDNETGKKSIFFCAKRWSGRAVISRCEQIAQCIFFPVVDAAITI